MGLLFNVIFNIHYCYLTQGYSRKGAALSKLYRFEEACEAFSDGLRVNPDNAALKEGMEDAKSHLTGK